MKSRCFTALLGLALLAGLAWSPAAQAQTQGCQVAWVVIAVKYKPTTFWTVKSGGYQLWAGASQETAPEKVKGFEDQALAKVRAEVKAKVDDDVRYEIESEFLRPYLWAEKSCGQEALRAKLKKIAEFLDQKVDQKKDLPAGFERELSDFIKR